MSTKASQKGTKGQTPGMTTIRERLQKAISRLVVFSIIPLVILTVILNLSSTMRTLEDDMLVVAEISADRINEELRRSYPNSDAVTSCLLRYLPRSRNSSISTNAWKLMEWSEAS